VQWYQTEILHLTVAASATRQGYGKALLCEAESAARESGARLLQCTIREGNTESRSLFEEFGFKHVSSFFNKKSGSNVAVLQKVLV
jgi:ribosomal protein S18 acetylase RimI-like enzyme